MRVAQYRVFDTGPVSAFAKADLLAVLKLLSAEYESVLVEPVVVGLQDGLRTTPKLQAVLDADWLHRFDLTSVPELRFYAQVGQDLIGSTNRNRGEAAVIAWALAHPGSEVVLDDGPARRHVERMNSEHKSPGCSVVKLPMKGSLRLILTAMQEGNISTTLASAIVDELILNAKPDSPSNRASSSIGSRSTDWPDPNRPMPGGRRGSSMQNPPALLPFRGGICIDDCGDRVESFRLR